MILDVVASVSVRIVTGIVRILFYTHAHARGVGPVYTINVYVITYIDGEVQIIQIVTPSWNSHSFLIIPACMHQGDEHL